MKRLVIPASLAHALLGAATLAACSHAPAAPVPALDGCTPVGAQYVCHPPTGCVEHRDRDGQLLDRSCAGGGCASTESYRGGYFFEGRCDDDAGCTTTYALPDVVASRTCYVDAGCYANYAGDGQYVGSRCDDDAGCRTLYAADGAFESRTCAYLEAGAQCTVIEAQDGAPRGTVCLPPEPDA